jgi:isoquinoline 1-oxidoreductase alpha subunit
MQLNINGQRIDVADDPGAPLLWVLRDELGMIGTRYGCGAGICGSCTVHVDGVATRACITPLESVAGRQIRTIEGLATASADGTLALHPVQQAFIDTQTPQCAWCMSGQIMTAAALLEQNPGAGEAEIVEAMTGNYCRCGCYVRIKAAVAQAGQQMLAARQRQEATA